MPLKSGYSSRTVGANIHELRGANAAKPAGKKRGMKQIIAIALSVARKAKKKGGKPMSARDQVIERRMKEGS